MPNRPPPAGPERPTSRREERGATGRQRREAEARRKRLRGRLLWAAAGLVLLGLIAVAVLGNRPGPASAGPVIDGIECNTSESLIYHIHGHLSIYDQGRPVTVPQGIGIDKAHGCIYWMHTHDTRGVMHIESPTEKHYTLGNFLDIWGQRVDSSAFLAHGIAPGHSVRAYVGKDRYSGNPTAILLTPHTLLTLEYGPPWVAPDTAYAFQPGE